MTDYEICIICQKPAKYRCPKCEKANCSVKCSREHKVAYDCDGIRDRTAFVDKGDMDNLTLLSDYRFLEEIDHKLDDGHRHPLRRVIAPNEFDSSLAPHLKKLKYEARLRGTTIEFMPLHFKKHQTNTSRYIYRERAIRWHIQWVFPQAHCTFSDKNVPENTTLTSLLRQYLVPMDGQIRKIPAKGNEQMDVQKDTDKTIEVHEDRGCNSEKVTENPMEEQCNFEKITKDNHEKLSYYKSASMSGICVLLRTERCRMDPKYVEMVPSQSLKLNLSGRKVVEHPTFYVVLKDHADVFLNLDEEEADVEQNKRIYEEVVYGKRENSGYSDGEHAGVFQRDADDHGSGNRYSNKYNDSFNKSSKEWDNRRGRSGRGSYRSNWSRGSNHHNQRRSKNWHNSSDNNVGPFDDISSSINTRKSPYPVQENNIDYNLSGKVSKLPKLDPDQNKSLGFFDPNYQ